MKFIPSDQYPRAFEVTGGAAPIVCQVTYIGHGNAHSGYAMDGQVLPLILAAPDLLEALMACEAAIAQRCWNAAAEAQQSAAAAIAKASPKP